MKGSCDLILGNHSRTSLLDEEGFDVAVGDYYINECFFVLAHELKLPTVAIQHVGAL